MSTYTKWRHLTGLALAGALLVTACGTAPAPQPAPPTPSPSTKVSSDAEREALRNMKGQENAPLVVAKFSDFS